MRVVVVGNSGSGKSTFAARLAIRLEVRYVELDAIYHQPGWQPLDDDVFRERVRQATESEGWVVDGNYSAVREMLWSHAQLVVILAYPRRVVMPRIIRRSLGRVVFRRELWNENRERWSNLMSWAPDQNIIRWAWTSHDKYNERYLTAMSDPGWSHLGFVRLTHPQQAAAFLDALGR